MLCTADVRVDRVKYDGPERLLGEFFNSKLPGGFGTESKESRKGRLAGRGCIQKSEEEEQNRCYQSDHQ